jgi:hypothetical protein
MNWEVKFVGLILILVVGIIGTAIYVGIGETQNIMRQISISSDSEESSIPDQSEFYLPTVTGENISSYKVSCKETDLDKSSKELESVKGQKIKVKGELYNIMQNIEGSTNIHVKIPNLSQYPYVIVSYSSKIPYSLGDKLEIYGEYNDFVDYENESVPFIKASYIEKV